MILHSINLTPSKNVRGDLSSVHNLLFTLFSLRIIKIHFIGDHMLWTKCKKIIQNGTVLHYINKELTRVTHSHTERLSTCWKFWIGRMYTTMLRWWWSRSCGNWRTTWSRASWSYFEDYLSFSLVSQLHFRMQSFHHF